MQIKEIMTARPATCTPDTNLQIVAQMMVDCDCGAILVIDATDADRPLGIVTDRDITTRIVARNQNPLQKRAQDAMTEATVTVEEAADVDEAIRLMEENRIRRLLVVDDGGACTGIIAQADLARQANDRETGEVVEAISEPTPEASEASAA